MTDLNYPLYCLQHIRKRTISRQLSPCTATHIRTYPPGFSFLPTDSPLPPRPLLIISTLIYVYPAVVKPHTLNYVLTIFNVVLTLTLQEIRPSSLLTSSTPPLSLRSSLNIDNTNPIHPVKRSLLSTPYQNPTSPSSTLHAPEIHPLRSCTSTQAEAPCVVSQYIYFYVYMHVADRKSTRLNSSHSGESRMPSSA